MAECFAYSLRVRYSECDPQGVVFNANYLSYLDNNMTELWRAALGSYQAMLDRGIDMVVVEAGLRFHAPARFDDELTMEVAVTRIGNTSVSTAHRIRRGPDLVAEGTLHHVLVDRTSLTKTPVPDWIRSALQRWAPEAA
jgi:acyl-CoA thioester hydrolase